MKYTLYISVSFLLNTQNENKINKQKLGLDKSKIVSESKQRSRGYHSFSSSILVCTTSMFISNTSPCDCMVSHHIQIISHERSALIKLNT